MHKSFTYLFEDIVFSLIKELDFYQKKNFYSDKTHIKILCCLLNILLFVLLIIVKVYKRYVKMYTTSSTFYGFVAIFVSVILAIYGFSYCNVDDVKINKTIQSFVNVFYANIASGLIGISITVLLIDRINGNRFKQHTLDEIVARTRSRINYMALEAVEELRIHGWLKNASLANKVLNGNLAFADFEGADLSNADFSGARLMMANFSESECEHAVFVCSDLEQSNITSAKLHYVEAMGANFFKANLSKSNAYRGNFYNANLSYANLNDVEWIGVDLKGANLLGASLLNANLSDSIFDKYTIMPDNIEYNSAINLDKYIRGNT